MASCVLKKMTLDASFDGKDAATSEYQADFGSPVADPYLALALAQSLGPHPVPPRMGFLAGSANSFVQSISAEPESALGTVWMFRVSYGPPPTGEDEEQRNPNPLLRPPVYNIDYQEQEYVVKQARNMTELTGGFTRPVGTLGPIVNAAFRRPDEPIVRTRRVGVIVIEKNFADLGEILDLNEDFQDTTNSDSITLGTKTFSARRLKFEVCRSGGKQIENDVVYYPGVTEITIYKTTDLVLDNVGFEYWDAGANDYIRALDPEGQPTAEPVNLNLDGTLKNPGGLGDDGPTTITYRDLDEVEYSGFFE